MVSSWVRHSAGNSCALTGGKREAEVPSGGLSISGAAALLTEVRGVWALLAGFDFLTLLLLFFFFLLLVFFFLVVVACAPPEKREKRAEAARNCLRFKSGFLSMPTVFKRGVGNAPARGADYSTSAAWSARRERSPLCNVM